MKSIWGSCAKRSTLLLSVIGHPFYCAFLESVTHTYLIVTVFCKAVPFYYVPFLLSSIFVINTKSVIFAEARKPEPAWIQPDLWVLPRCTLYWVTVGWMIGSSIGSIGWDPLWGQPSPLSSTSMLVFDDSKQNRMMVSVKFCSAQPVRSLHEKSQQNL